MTSAEFFIRVPVAEDCAPSASGVCKVTRKTGSWDERMSAASLEADDAVLHADADPELFFFSSFF